MDPPMSYEPQEKLGPKHVCAVSPAVTTGLFGPPGANGAIVLTVQAELLVPLIYFEAKEAV